MKFIKLCAFAFIIMCQAHFSIAAEVPQGESEKDSFAKDKILMVCDTDYVLGNKDAKITLIEYSSLSCPHCASFHNDVLPKLRKDYIDKGLLLYVHRHFPTNKPSLVASLLASCNQDYFEFLGALFLAQQSWAFSENFEKDLFSIAKLYGMEKAEFRSCIDNEALKGKIYQDTYDASRLLDIRATPVFFLNGERIEGALHYEAIASKIDSVLKMLEVIKRQKQ